MKNILVLINDSAGREARIQAALDLARALDGHLSCFKIVDLPPRSIEERLTAEDVPWSVLTSDGNVAERIAREAGLSDVIVADCLADGPLDPDMLGIPSEIVLETHKPMVAVPETSRGFDAAGHAVVAWDGSFPAMAALTGAAPLLRLAASVGIVEVQADRPSSVHDAAAYLSRHGIHPEVRLVPRSEGGSAEPAEVIRQICANEAAAYCVMGAYGHSRLRETLFGGVTRSMLGSSDIPLVVAH
jgi:nucleotide-binding universal stress UspA family protein